MPPQSDLLGSYLQHHWSAAQGGLDLFRRSASGHSDAETRATLAELAEEVADDRRALGELMKQLGVTPSVLGPLIAGIGERLGRLKPNGSLIRRSPLSDVVELEALTAAVAGKQRGWLSLLHVAETDDRLDRDQLEELVQRADHQLERLEPLRLKSLDQLITP
ncbi:hypothetical protein [Calidifontibacter terrae]